MIRQIYQTLAGTGMKVVIRIILAEGSRFPELTEVYFHTVVARGTAALQRILAEGIAAGVFRDGAATSLPVLVLSPVLLATLWKLTFDRIRPLDLDAAAGAHLDLIFNGIRA